MSLPVTGTPAEEDMLGHLVVLKPDVMIALCMVLDMPYYLQYHLMEYFILISLTCSWNGIWEMVEARGCHLKYLPPYLPDFNLIEEGFSALKYNICRKHTDVLAKMDNSEDANPVPLLWDAVYESMTPENIAGWYRNCGYLSCMHDNDLD
ncbi:transposase [Moniliophthora roreri MCA 2997]|uniref:Transposase n=1 Tax=Moniliophthora roreri (strain MCA 2997) TaxID=1381753 RepID=V2XMC7_MONRO|nr:transposase [Moniliophthora roreri MCA 2997]